MCEVRKDDILSACPHCGLLPEISDFEEDTYSRKKNNFGRKFTACAHHFCMKVHKSIGTDGTGIIVWGDFNTELAYKIEDIEAAEEKARQSAIRKWNRKIKNEKSSLTKALVESGVEK